MLVIDADAHVEESEATWSHLAPEFHERRPLPVTLPGDTAFREHNAVWLIDRKVRQSAANPTTMRRALKKQITIGSQELTDVPARLADLERFGVEKQVLYPSSWLGCLAEDPDLEGALARSYNTFMAAQCNASGGRLFYGAIVPFRAPSAAVAEIRRVRELGGAVSVFVRGIEWDMPLSHPSFWPIYAEAERQGLVMAVHTGFGSPTINHMFDGLPPLPGELPFIPPRGGFLVSGLLVQFAFVSVLRAGLLEEFPKLRWAFLEVGSEWLPAAMRAARLGPKASRLLEDGRVCLSCEPDEDLPYLIGKFGAEWPIVASDMPHTDDFHHDRPEDVFRSRGDLSEEVLEKLLRSNARRLYGI